MAYYQNNGNYGNKGGGGFNSKPDLSETPNAVQIVNFYTSEGNINPDLFDKVANEVAHSFVGKDKRGNDVGVSSTQLRKIFDEVKRFEQVLLTGNNQWDKQLPYIKMIKSKVAYSVARSIKNSGDAAGVYKNMEKFISSCIDLVKKEEDYHVFVSLFEAAYGFYYELAPKNCK